jgi:hypothetical protein
MLVSVHIADLGPLRSLEALWRPPRVDRVPGLTSAVTVFTATLGSRRPPPPGRAAMIASWEDDAALDRFLGQDRLGRRLAEGWHVRLEPLRVFGSWPAIPGLPEREQPHDSEEPVVVLTLGRPRLKRLRPFFRAAAPAEADAVAEPGLLASAGLARPPRLVSTFSIWRSAAEMRDYATRAGGTHSAAVDADRERPFHHESAFIRFRPYASRGSWDGRDPLAGVRGRVAA